MKIRAGQMASRPRGSVAFRAKRSASRYADRALYMTESLSEAAAGSDFLDRLGATGLPGPEPVERKRVAR